VIQSRGDGDDGFKGVSVVVVKVMMGCEDGSGGVLMVELWS
jgi:hypothetical protein